MKKLTNFVFYNNTVPILLGVLFLGAGATFAASPDVREVMVSSQTSLASVDNVFLLDTNISMFPFSVVVLSVTENEFKYFVDYELHTIGVVDGAWQPVTIRKTLEIQKDAIFGQDLGHRVEEELLEVRNYELRRLSEEQKNQIEIGLTAKVIVKEYDGLVGRYLDSETETFPGYTPVIVSSPAEPSLPQTSNEPEAQETFTASLEGEEIEISKVIPKPTSVSNPSTTTTASTTLSASSASSTDSVTKPKATSTQPTQQDPKPTVSATTPAPNSAPSPEPQQTPQPDPENSETPPPVEPDQVAPQNP